MGDSLQDQLRSLGLAKKDPQGGGKRRGKGSRQAKRPRNAGGGGAELSLDRAWALREQEEKRAAQEAKRAKLAEERRRREINTRLRALVEANRLNVAESEVPRHFLYRGRIRKLYVTAEQQQALSDGRMGIVYLGGSYHLLDPEHIEAARAIDPGHVVDLGDGRDAGEADDGHEVPDDLVW